MNKSLKFSILCFGACLAFVSVSPVPAAPPSATMAGKADSVSIAVQVLGGHIYVPATVNGHSARLVLDSGAGGMVLTPEFAQKLGLLSDDKSAEATGTAGRVKVSRATLTTLEVAGAKLETVEAYVIPMPQALQADGLLGFDFFRAFVVTIDYENARLTLTRPKAFKPIGDGITLTLTRTPAIEAALDGHKARLEIDTGDSGVATFNTPFVEREKLRAAYTPHFELSTGRGVGGRTYGTVARAKTLTLGKFDLSGPIVELSSQKTGVEAGGEDDGRIGSEILSRFVVTFDYSRKKLFLTPNAKLAAPFVYNRSGLGFDMDDYRTTIVSVLPGSLGEAAGVKIGDEVLAVNDVIVAKLPKGELKRLTTAPPGTSVKFTLRRAPADPPFAVDVILKDLL